MKAIEVKNLTKIYQDKTKALNSLSLSVNQGEIFTLLGKNSAGKSTLINILTTFVTQTTGYVKILGKNLKTDSKEIRKNISCVTQKSSIDNHLSLTQNMTFQGQLYGLNNVEIKTQINKLIQLFHLNKFTAKKVSSYSGGVRRRLDIAMSVMSKPKILFLDEPTVGMDIESRINMWEYIKNIQKELNTTIFLTTHYLEEADKLSDTICIIKNGHELVQDSPSNLKKHLKNQLIQINFEDKNNLIKFSKLISEENYIQNISRKENTLLISASEIDNSYKQILKIIANKEISTLNIAKTTPSIDDVFLTLTKERSI